MGTEKKNTVTIEFKDPDLGSDFERAGVTPKAIDKLMKLAEFSEYWKLELTMNPDGSIAAAKFANNR